MAQIVVSSLQPHTRQKLDPNDYLQFPDDGNEIPEGMSPKERQLWLRMNRIAKE